MKKKLFVYLAVFFTSLQQALAHCPLCTAGAAVAAGGAAYLGVDNTIIALFIGAFAVSTGLWSNRWFPKQYVRYQKQLLVVLAFALTVIPILPIIPSVLGMPIFLYGSYGSLLNRTYIINVSLLAALFGGFIVIITPYISRKISLYRDGKMFPYQGMLLTLLLLIITGILLQVIL